MKEIVDCYDSLVRQPLRIQTRLIVKELQNLTIHQIKNVLKKLKEENLTGSINLGELTQIIQRYSTIPDNEAFICNTSR